MTKIYTKKKRHPTRLYIRLTGLLMCLLGIVMVAYFTFPLLAFQLYLKPVLAEQAVATPIPKTSMLTEASFADLIQSTADSLKGVDYNNAKNWYPSIQQAHTDVAVAHYTLSIPKLGISDADVSTVDNDLGSHLVQYGGTAVPPSKGTAVIFGHSTL
ncbi:MAG TPA: hypothetical protein VG935_03260, partial [Patescibacteria group bacterium]|nr:hypothetical protein [Patescibacteria group bacterium]